MSVHAASRLIKRILMISASAVENLQPAWSAGVRRIKMKRLLSLVCCLLVLVTAPLAIQASATQDVSGTASAPEVSQAMPSETPSEPSTDEGEFSSEAPTSSEEFSSEFASSEVLSEPEIASSSQVSSVRPNSNSNTVSQQEEANSTVVNMEKGENKGAAVLIFCYIIAVLIGSCLVVLIFANVYIPIARKKKELKYFDDRK